MVVAFLEEARCARPNGAPGLFFKRAIPPCAPRQIRQYGRCANGEPADFSPRDAQLAGKLVGGEKLDFVRLRRIRWIGLTPRPC